MNLRPSGYEPDELPGCSTPRYGAGNRDRTGTRFKSHGILSPGRLPISPFRHFRSAFPSAQGIISHIAVIVNTFSEKSVVTPEKGRGISKKCGEKHTRHAAFRRADEVYSL